MRCWFEGAGRRAIADIPLGRRLLVAVVALACAGTLFRGQLASGLVSRGDEFLQSGALLRAQVYYARALRFDRNSPTAAERFAFAGLMLKTPSALRAAVAVASDALALQPGDQALRNDRALCLDALGDYGAARRDFEELAKRTGDARYYEFAAQAARRSGEIPAAARLFAHVIALNPNFAAARRELARLESKR